MVVEHAFGLLKNRFRRLGHFENLKLKIIVKCIMASCVLHNMCILQNDILDIDVNILNEDGMADRAILPNINDPVVGANWRQQVFEDLFHEELLS